MGSGGGVVAVSAYMGGTRGSGVLDSAGDVLEMSVVGGVGGVCDMCTVCVRGGVGGVDGRSRYLYCARRIPAHLRCTQCSFLLHLIDICFLTCICLWKISQIQQVQPYRKTDYKPIIYI